MKRLAWIALMLLPASLVAAKQEPVTVVVIASADAVKSNAVRVAIAQGYTIDQEGQFQLVFAKNMTGAGSFVTKMLVTPSACTSITPRWLITVIVVPGQDSVTLNARSEYEHAGPLCRPVRETPDGKNVRQQIERFLQNIKSASERPATTTAPPPLSKEETEKIKANSEAGKASPAAAAAMAQEGHVLTPDEMAERVKQGQASRCSVVTAPAGAEVYIDGNKAGVTPFVFVLMKRDQPRILTIKMAGYKTVEKEIVPDGKVIPLGLTLERE